MTSDITTSTTPTLTLEQCDEAAVQGILLLKKAVFNYAQHGLTGTEIGKRVRDLGATLSDSQARRYIQSFRADKLLPEKEESQHPKAVAARRQRAANAQNAQTQPPQPQPEPEIIEAEFTTTQSPDTSIAQARLESLPPDSEIAEGLGRKTCGYIVTGSHTLCGLLDFIDAGDHLTEEAYEALSRLHHRLNHSAEKLNRPFKAHPSF